jgi:hypothetical protein
LWKQVNQQRQQTRRQQSSRWRTQPLVLVLLFMTWCSGDSQAERFEIAKAYCQAAWMNKRRSPGKSVQGFQKALARLPLRTLRILANGVRKLLEQRLEASWYCHGFVPVGCDGSRVTCPRSVELEKRLGAAGKDKSAPTLWVTALVHLRLGVPLSWRFGLSNACERWHLLQMLKTLPRQVLLVADAGYVGYQLARQLMQNDVKFLLRMCSTVTLYRADRVGLQRYREGIVYYWPSRKDAKAGALPLTLRLIRIRAKRCKNDVWLLTNVMDSERLSLEWAARFYLWRWQSEGCFRTYKHTLKKVKLVSRTLRLVHREAEGSWLALQLLLVQGVLAQQQRASQRRAKGSTRRMKKKASPRPDSAKKAPSLPAGARTEASLYSPRQILLAIRWDIQAQGQRRRHERYYAERVLQAEGEERPNRTSAKASRVWPRRKPHKPPKPPKLRTLNATQKALISRLESQAA